MNPRRPLTQKQKEAIWIRQKGKCASCNLPFAPSRMQDDHHLARVDGGGEELANRRLVCVPCHRPKSVREHKANKKAKRLRFGKAKRSAPMPGSRDSKIKRHLDGTWSWR